MSGDGAHVIGLISDTHGLVRADVHTALAGVELILHAGDVGGDEVLDELELIAPVLAVYGNTDAPGDARLAESIERTIGGVRIHVSHGHELGSPTAEKLLERYAGRCDRVRSHASAAGRAGGWTTRREPGRGGPTPIQARAERGAADDRARSGAGRAGAARGLRPLSSCALVVESCVRADCGEASVGVATTSNARAHERTGVLPSIRRIDSLPMSAGSPSECPMRCVHLRYARDAITLAQRLDRGVARRARDLRRRRRAPRGREARGARSVVSRRAARRDRGASRAARHARRARSAHRVEDGARGMAGTEPRARARQRCAPRDRDEHRGARRRAASDEADRHAGDARRCRAGDGIGRRERVRAGASIPSSTSWWRRRCRSSRAAR